MTLNLTLAAPWGIHQSSDFRLVDGTSGALVQDVSPKLITLQYLSWTAAISYCGVGGVGATETYVELGKWLTHPSGSRTLNEVLAIIKTEGEEWLRVMPRRYPHTFIVGAFISKEPSVTFISNFEDIRGSSSSPTDVLRISSIRPRTAHVLITGTTSGVTRINRTILKAVLKRRYEPLRVRQFMASVNREASQMSPFISLGCYAHSLLPDGTGGGERHGDVVKDFIPVMILNGINFRDQMLDLLKRGIIRRK